MLEKKHLFFITLSVILLIAFSGCLSKYEKLRRSNNTELKYNRAKEYYEKKDYFRSLQLFEELAGILRGTEKGEECYYLLSECHFGVKDYLSARYYYGLFTETYPKSAFAEEAYFKIAKCYYLDSPVWSLEQDNTYKALESLQLFVSLYPESSKIEDCNSLIDNLRLKLETKSFEGAKLYFNIEEYKAAIIAFENSINEFPDSKYREEMEFLSIKSGYLYAKNSIAEKQKERYELTIGYYLEFIKNNPESVFVKEAENIYGNCIKALEEISKNKENEYSN